MKASKPAAALIANGEKGVLRCGICKRQVGELVCEYGVCMATLLHGYEMRGDRFEMGPRAKERYAWFLKLATNSSGSEAARARQRLVSGNISPFRRAPEKVDSMTYRYRKANDGGRGGSPRFGPDGEIGSFTEAWNLSGGELVECHSCGCLNAAPMTG